MDVPLPQSHGDDVQPVAPNRPAVRSASISSVLAWLRGRMTTTPGRLELVSLLVVVGALTFGIVGLSAERSSHRAAQTVARETEPLLVDAVGLYTSLSDADATATTTFLTGGLEPPARRARYVEDLRMASSSLASLSQAVGASAGPRHAVSTITNGLPRYSGLVEAARADNRQRLPVGAAYLRQASELLSTSILPAAGQLYETEAKRLNDGFSAGTAASTLIGFTVVVVLCLILLAFAQWYLARVSKRILNVPMLAATGVLGVLSVWGLIAFAGEQNALSSAQRHGSDSVEVLSATRILASRAQSDESLSLVSRGGDAQPVADFNAVMERLTSGRGESGLLGEVAVLAKRTGTSPAAAELASTLSSYRTQHARIAALAGGGRFLAAVDLEVKSAASGASPSDRLSSELARQIATAQRRFARDAGDATSALAGLSIAIPGLAMLAAGLALLGVRQRLSEYR